MKITRKKLAELIEAKKELKFNKSFYQPVEYELAENSINGLIEDLENQLKIFELKKSLKMVLDFGIRIETENHFMKPTTVRGEYFFSYGNCGKYFYEDANLDQALELIIKDIEHAKN